MSLGKYPCKKNLKRCAVAGVFLVLGACTEAPDTNETSNISTTVEAEGQGAPLPPAPLLSLSELLQADDLKQALAQASRANDEVALAQWQARLLQAADEVDLLDSERALLEGEQGIAFLRYQGMKVNFQEEFEAAFFDFQDPTKVYEKYPAFETLKARSERLIAQRNELIQRASEVLQEEGLSQEQAQAEARRQWQLSMLGER